MRRVQSQRLDLFVFTSNQQLVSSNQLYSSLANESREARSRTNSCKVPTTGTERRMPRKPASFAPTMRPIMTSSGGTPTTLVTTRGR